jgi:hypothetical protein
MTACCHAHDTNRQDAVNMGSRKGPEHRLGTPSAELVVQISRPHGLLSAAGDSLARPARSARGGGYSRGGCARASGLQGSVLQLRDHDTRFNRLRVGLTAQSCAMASPTTAPLGIGMGCGRLWPPRGISNLESACSAHDAFEHVEDRLLPSTVTASDQLCPDADSADPFLASWSATLFSSH